METIEAEEMGLAISIEEGLNSGLLNEKEKLEFLSKHRSAIYKSFP